MTLMDVKEKLKQFELLIEELIKENEDYPVLVEGKRDVNALRVLGLEGEIIVLHSGRSILETCEVLADEYDTVLLMLDWDRKGKYLTKTVKQNLMTLGIKAEDKFMNKIFSLARKETKEVEGLDRFYQRLCKSSKRYRIDKFTRATEFAEKRGRHP